jgi:membrane protease subunit HflK
LQPAGFASISESFMPWNNQSGSGNGQGPRGPWSGGPSGEGGPPDLEELLRRIRVRLQRLMPSGEFTAGSLGVAAVVLLGLWLASGFYVVSSREQGVVLRFGQVVAHTSTGAGLSYHLPWPIETVETPEVTRVNLINIGYESSSEASDPTQAGDVPSESLMLTGDENIVDINFTVFWVIKDATAYLFNVENPQNDPNRTIKAVAESAMREVVGQNEIDPIITEDREPVAIKVRELMQKTLDGYGAGVAITRVQLQNAGPPPEVIDAYRDVQKARADQEGMRNQAEAYANKIIPEARGQAANIVQQAEAYRQQAIAEASGEAKQFLSVYQEYRKAPEVTRRRMYIETMSQVLAPMNKIILDDAGGHGVVPYLPLPGLDAKRNDQGAQAQGPVVVTAPQIVAGPQQ